MIVTMATENYLKWLVLFLESVGRFKHKTKVYLINVSKAKESKIRNLFPNVKFISEKREIERKEGFKGSFKVTYLKGEFLERAYEDEPLIWFDCTALVLQDPQEIIDLLKTNKAVLNRRNFNVDFGKSVYAAEIIGFNDLEEIRKYRANCEKRKSEWFADQLALCEIACKKDYIKFGEWSNFYYDPYAKSWSDRGTDGSGINNQDQEEYTTNKYLEFLEKYCPGIRAEFRDFALPDKIKILVHIDNDSWCYANSVRKVMELLKDRFEFVPIYSAQRQAKEVAEFNGDLVWARCGAYRNHELRTLNNALTRKTFSSLTTGGELLLDRLNKTLSCNENECGLIVQNEEAKIFAEDLMKGKRDQKVWVLPNGCDIEKFKPVRKDKFVVGFAGRVKNAEGNGKGKGYDYYRLAMKDLDLNRLELTGNEGYCSFEEMPSFYEKISILVLPSNSEGCSNTINEALSAGVPVLTVKTGWHGEVCNEESDGVIWISRNIKDVRTKIEELSRDPERVKKLGQNARRWAEEHSWEKIVPIYEQAFNEMLQETLRSKTITGRPAGMIRVRALRETNLGQIDRTGINYFIAPKEIKDIPYTENSKPHIDRYIRGRFLQVVQ